MSSSRNTCSGSTASNKTLAIIPHTSTNSPYLTKSDLNNIHNEIKYMTDKNHLDMKAMSKHITGMRDDMKDYISAMLAKTY